MPSKTKETKPKTPRPHYWVLVNKALNMIVIDILTGYPILYFTRKQAMEECSRGYYPFKVRLEVAK